jgi:hypothetical protein
MAMFALAAQAVSGLVSAFGSFQKGMAESNADKFAAQQAQNNSKLATENAAIATQAGSEQAAQSSLRTRAQVGEIRAQQGASGIEVNSGSAIDTQISERMLGKLDAETVRSNATKEAFGYVTQAQDFKNEANQDLAAAKNAKMQGILGAAGGVLGAAGSAASSYSSYQAAGSLGGGKS